MEIVIKGTPEEIADLITALQDRLKESHYSFSGDVDRESIRQCCHDHIRSENDS